MARADFRDCLKGLEEAKEWRRVSRGVSPEYVATVSIKKRLEGEARNVILSILCPTAGAPQAKWAIVVDGTSTCTTGTRSRGCCTRACSSIGAPLDPSAPLHRHTFKIGSDATVPLGVDRDRMPGWSFPAPTTSRGEPHALAGDGDRRVAIGRGGPGRVPGAGEAR